MNMYEIIRKKRDGGTLSAAEIAFFVEGYTKGDIPDYQASALAMAIYFKGMDAKETAALTMAMAASGDTVDLSRFGTLSVDKHSTGGVGDKTSLIVAPIVAACGGFVTKMSGRGLGHTGGTVDKLESIPGYQTTLSTEAFLNQAQTVGLALIGQSGNLTPADKKLYALRDVTATVDSMPLIVSSIMSKKLAAGSHNIVLDVKVGNGAFMKTERDARALAKAMVDIGERCGRRCTAVISNMDAPLGFAVGNALEVKEAVKVLKGEQKGELRELCLVLADEMLTLVKEIPPADAFKLAEQALDSGAAFQKMKQWIAAQGGDTAYLDDVSLFPLATYEKQVYAVKSGYITAMNAEEIGRISVLLGAGRATKSDSIDMAAGIVLHKKTGDAVQAGEVLATLYTERADTLDDACARYIEAVTVAETPAKRPPLISDIIRKV